MLHYTDKKTDPIVWLILEKTVHNPKYRIFYKLPFEEESIAN